jgi:glycogen synthase
MNILMLGWELPPHNSGGLGVACYHLAKALSLQGTSIDFIVPYSAPHEDIDFMTVHSATTLSPLDRYGQGAYDSQFLLDHKDGADLAGVKNIRDVQRHYTRFIELHIETTDTSYDAIHAHDWLTMEAGIRAKQITDAPLIVHVHSTEFDRSGGGDGNPIAREIEYQGLIVADRIIAVSEVTKQIIISQYGISADKIEVMHNAIDVTSFDNGYEYDRRTYRYLESLKSEGYTIVSAVTRLTIQKGLTNLIRAMAMATQKYDRIALLLAGDGEQRNELIQLASDLGISDKVFFTGFVRGKQWRDAYSVSDIFVLSSVSEPFGLTALEAAHHDTALILTRQSGVTEVLNNVYKYDFWDVTRLADQLIGIATSYALRDTLKENVRREYARISWDDVATKLRTTYGNVVRKPERVLV